MEKQSKISIWAQIALLNNLLGVFNDAESEKHNEKVVGAREHTLLKTAPGSEKRRPAGADFRKIGHKKRFCDYCGTFYALIVVFNDAESKKHIEKVVRAREHTVVKTAPVSEKRRPPGADFQKEGQKIDFLDLLELFMF